MEQDIDKRLEKLRDLAPPLRSVLFSEKTSEVIEGLVKRYNLESHHEQISDRVVEVLFGELNPQDLMVRLELDGIDHDTTLHTTQEIQEKILEPIRIPLQKLYSSSRNQPAPMRSKTGENVSEPLDLREIAARKQPPSRPASSARLEELDEHEKKSLPPIIPAQDPSGIPTFPINPLLPRPNLGRNDGYREPVDEDEPPQGPRLTGNTIDLSKE